MVLGLQKRDLKAMGLIIFTCLAVMLIGLGGTAIQSALEISGLIERYATRPEVEWSASHALRVLLTGELYVVAGLALGLLVWKKRHWFG